VRHGKLRQVGLSVLVVTITVIALCELLGSPHAQAAATTRYVSPTGDCGSASPCYSKIQEAVDAAESGDLIKVAQGTYTSTALEVVYIDKALSISGGYSVADWSQPHPVTQTTTIEAGSGGNRGVYIAGTSALTITLSNLTIHGASKNSDGAGIHIVSGTIHMQNLIISGNTVGTYSGNRGGGVYMADGNLIVDESTFVGNTATYGGAIYFSGDTVLIQDCRFEGNVGGYGGGGIFASAQTVDISSSVFEDNDAPSNPTGGGGAYVSARLVDVTANEFRANQALYGGGLKASGMDVTVSGNLFQGNSCNGGGGGANLSGSALIVTANTFAHNVASTSGWYGGGGLYIAGVSTSGFGRAPVYTPAVVENNDFVSNAGRDGGGVYVAQGAIKLSRNSFHGNSAEASGGALFVTQPDTSGYSSIVTATANTYVNNFLDTHSWTLGGGDISIAGGELQARNEIIAETVSAAQAIFVTGGAYVGHHVTLVDNGDFALTTDGGMASLTNSIVASSTVGGLAGADITSDHTLFFNCGNPCMSGAVCANSITGDPAFANPLARDYHLTRGSVAIDTGARSNVLQDFDGEARPAGCGWDIGAYEFQALECTISSGGGQLYGAGYTLTFPPGTFTDTVVITATPLAVTSLPPLPSLLFSMDNQFEIVAFFQDTEQLAEPGGAYTLTAQYDEANLAGLPESKVALHYWDDGRWVREPDQIIDASAKTVLARPDHLSIWAVLGQAQAHAYLPMVIR